MDDWILGLALGIMLVLIGTLLLRLELCHKSLIYGLERSRADLVSAIDQTSAFNLQDSTIDAIKQEIGDTINDVAGQMRVPTAIVHLAGVAANIFQMREQWKIQKEASEMNAPLITSPVTPEDYGTP